MILRPEPSPNPQSRLTLTESRDHYGMRRVQLDWRINAEDFERLDRISDLLAKKVGAANLGRVRRTFHDSAAESGRQFRFPDLRLCHPTLTIVAQASRRAGHLKSELAG